MSDLIRHTSSIGAIEQHVRNYRSALKSTLEVTISSLSVSHLKMNSTLHPLGSNTHLLDVSAFSYSLSRLPSVVDKAYKIIIGQEPNTFTNAGFDNVSSWQKVSAQSRRRATYFHPGKKIIAYYIASVSDIDDLTNTLIAYQTEWNKLHQILHSHYKTYQLLKKALENGSLPKTIELTSQDWTILTQSLGINWKIRLKRIYQQKQNQRLQLLSASWINYNRTTQKWWKNIATNTSTKFHISRQEIYFVSSNTHSLLNLITGFALKHKTEIIDFIKLNQPNLYLEWQKIQSQESNLPEIDFINYALKFCSKDKKIEQLFLNYQKKLGVISIPPSDYLDIGVQIFPIKNLVKSTYLDSRLKIKRPKKLLSSNALIFNIDYPLGFSAYHILTEILENVKKVKGVYVLGKAAVLNGEVGDIQIPRLVFDEHTQNSYIFKNCFNSFFPFSNPQGSILTNQKSVSVLGTFLENKALLDTYSKNNLTIIEMESGSYLSAITEASYDQQSPKNTIVDLNNAPFDIGIVNYTSDTPFSSLQNLGFGNLGISGVEPVTLGALAILQRIINLEESF
jgi:hypothetical protein